MAPQRSVEITLDVIAVHPSQRALLIVSSRLQRQAAALAM